MGKMVYVRNRKTKPSETGGSDGWWPDKKKMEVLTSYLATGNLKMSAALYNVPYETTKKWKQSDWWKERIIEIQSDDNVKLDSKLQRVMNKTLEALEDRIDNGEYYIDRRTGKQKRMPASMRDVHRVASDLIKQQQSIRNLNVEKPKEELSTTNDRLLRLAEQFAELATGKAKDPIADLKDITIIEGEVTGVEEVDTASVKEN